MSEIQDLTVAYEKVIFSRLFKRDEDVVVRRNELMAEINVPEAFNNEYYVFYIMIQQMPKLLFDKDYVRLFLNMHRANFDKNPQIDYTDYTVEDNDSYLTFIDSCIDVFNECTTAEVDDSGFYLNLQKYKMVYIQRESLNILETGSEILVKGKLVKRRSYSGYQDMRNFTTDQFNKLDKVVQKSKRRGALAYGITEEDENEGTALKCISGYGIPELDEHIMIYEGEMHNILAPSKGGKSRFCTQVIETALVEYGQNCLMWSIENGQKGWEYLFRARHFNRIYNSTVTDVFQKKILTDADLKKGHFVTPELKELEEASWLAFKNNEKYGTLVSLDEDLNIDTFIDIIDENVNRYNISLICVDYLQLIGRGKSAFTSKNELIAEAYRLMLQYLKHKKIAGIFPCQFKQTVVSNLSKAKPEELVNVELRDSAGETYEIIKTPDVNIALYATVADLKNGDMKLLSIPSRTSATFDPIDLVCNLGASTFVAAKGGN